MSFFKTRKRLRLLCLLFFITLLPHLAFAKGPKVLLFLWHGETSAEKGLKDVLDKEYNGNIQYTIIDIDKDVDNIGDKIESIVESDYNLIYSYGSPITFRISKSFKNIPILFNIVYDPIGYGITDDWQKRPENITGISNSIPSEIQLEKMFKLFGRGDIGFIYNAQDEDSLRLKEEMEAVFKSTDQEFNSFEYNNNFRDFRSFVNKNKNHSVCFYIVSGGKMTKDVRRILAELNRNKVPTCVTSKSYLKQGALLCIATDYYELGKKAGAYAAQILSGKRTSNLPILRPEDKDIELYVNSSILAKVNIALPRDVKIYYIQK